MPTIDVSLSDLSKLAEEPLSAASLEALLPLVKGELKGADGDALRIELNDTNRPDLWSPEGIARQWRARRLGPQRYPFFERAPHATATVQADPALAAVRPWVGGFIARGPAVTDASLKALIQTQEKLSDNFGAFRKSLSMGIYRAAGIAFPVFYRAVGRDERKFVPLGFDAEMTLAEILERHPKGVQYGKGTLPAEGPVPVLEDSKGKILSFAPIINSRASGEVKVGDTELFVEMTGTAFWQMILGLNIMAANLADRGYAIEGVNTLYAAEGVPPLGRMVVAPNPLLDRFVREGDLPVRLASDLLGSPLGAEEIAEALARYGVEASPQKDKVACRIPAWRMDLMHPVDLVEDVLLARGLDSVAPRMPEEFTVGRADPLGAFGDAGRAAWIGLGFEEIFSNVLCAGEDLAERAGGRRPAAARILNPYSASYSVLRDTLLASLLRVEGASAKALYPHRVFEVGEVERAEGGSFRTELRLSALVAHEKANFSELQASLWGFFSSWQGTPSIRKPAAHPDSAVFIPGRFGEILWEGKPVGVIGEIAPAVLEAWGIRVPCAALEISLSAFHRLAARA